MTQEQFVPDIEQVKKVSLQFQEIFQRMDREIGVLDGLIAELDQQIQTTRRSRVSTAKSLNVMPQLGSGGYNQLSDRFSKFILLEIIRKSCETA